MKNIFKLLTLAFLTSGLSSCLNDEMIEDQKYGMINENANSIIEYSGDQASFRTSVLEITNTPQVITRTVRLASANTFNEDITVTVEPEAIKLANLNTDITDEADYYQLVSSQAYTVEPAIIKAGEREAVLRINVNTSLLDQTKNNALSLKLKTDKGLLVSGNMGTALIGIALPNIYEGMYEAVGVFTHPTSGPRDIHEDKELTTVNRNTVEAPLGDLGGSGYSMWLKVNADNTVTLTKAGATPNISPIGINVYDPVSKSFTLNYQYTASNGPRTVSETITMKE